MELVESFLTNNPCYKAGNRLAVRGLMLHSVGCAQPSAEVFVSNWNTPKQTNACVHAFIDGNTGKVYQTLPWDYQAWHGGGRANQTHIGVEMCEPACIHYNGGSSFSCTDMETARAVVKRTYDAAVELFAFLCQRFGLDPLADGVILSHKEGHDRGIASGHADPNHLWDGLLSGYTMDGFRRDVKAKMVGGSTPTDTPSDSIQAGSVVVLLPDAVYDNGKAIPGWVKHDRWIVKSISGDRVIIDKNVSGSHAICSAVHRKYLRPVS